MTIQHHNGCSSDYPEKTPGEAPQAVTTDTLSELNSHLLLRTCNDCGAFELVRVAGWFAMDHTKTDHWFKDGRSACGRLSRAATWGLKGAPERRPCKVCLQKLTKVSK
jgi:hypothetical protein